MLRLTGADYQVINIIDIGKNVTLSILLFVVGWLVLLVSFGK